VKRAYGGVCGSRRSEKRIKRRHGSSNSVSILGISENGGINKAAASA